MDIILFFLILRSCRKNADEKRALFPVFIIVILRNAVLLGHGIYFQMNDVKEYESDGVTLMDEISAVIWIINYFIFYLMMIVFINIFDHLFSNIKGVRLFSVSFGILGLLLLITATIASLGNDFSLTMAIWIGGAMVLIEVICVIVY